MVLAMFMAWGMFDCQWNWVTVFTNEGTVVDIQIDSEVYRAIISAHIRPYSAKLMVVHIVDGQ